MDTKTINVGNATQLAAAIRTARGGETLLLAAGSYGALSIKGRMLAETVTIKSADPANDARFTDLRIDKSSGFRFEDVDIDRPLAPGEADFTQAAYISSSSNIAFVGVDFRGSMDGNAANDGIALRVTSSSNIAVSESSFEQWTQAGVFSGSDRVSVTGNNVVDVVKAFATSTMTNSVVADNDVGLFATGAGNSESPGISPVGTSGTSPGINPGGGPGVNPGGGAGKVISVSTPGQLAAAIKSATGGETILVAPGQYGELTVKGRMLNGTVTIKSADSANDAVFSEIRVHASSGFVFNDLDVHRPLVRGEGDWTQAAYVSSSKRIDFVGVDFTGSLDNNPWNDGVGLRVANTDDFRLIDSTFQQWTNAVTFSQVDRLAVIGNSVTDVREGMNFAAVHDVTIAQNRLTGFDPNYARGDHSDAIQFWNAGVNEGSSRVVIRDNIIMQGPNGGTQGIFIGAENRNARHSDFLIENNLYNGDARHGITIYGIDGAVIRGNTVTSAVGGYLEAGININRSTAVLAENNISPMLLQDTNNSGVTLRGNIDLWDSKSKAGLTLAQVFETPSGDLFSEGNYVARGSAGFHGFDGIGAATFDLAHVSSGSQIGALLGGLLIV